MTILPPKLSTLNPARLRDAINDLIDYLRSVRLTAGKGIKLSHYDAGTVIEGTAVAQEAGSAATAEPEEMWHISLKRNASGVPTKVVVYDSHYKLDEASHHPAGTTSRGNVDYAEFSLPGSKLYLGVVLRPTAGAYAYTPSLEEVRQGEFTFLSTESGDAPVFPIGSVVRRNDRYDIYSAWSKHIVWEQIFLI